MKPLLTSAMFCIAILIFSCNKAFEKIEIPNDKIEKVKSSMKFVKQVLEKSTFDTLEIKKSQMQNEIDHKLLYNTRALSRDSISKEVQKSFVIDKRFPLTKEIYISHDTSFLLNERTIGNNVQEFKKNVMTCRELDKLTPKDRQNFIAHVLFLWENNIWCSSKSFPESIEWYEYMFTYSKDNIAISHWQDRYLYLDEDAPSDGLFNAEFKLLDRKNGLILCGDKL